MHDRLLLLALPPRREITSPVKKRDDEHACIRRVDGRSVYRVTISVTWNCIRLSIEEIVNLLAK